MFDFTVDFSKSAFGCEEPLKLTKFWQDSSFDLEDILKVNFHDEVMDDPDKTTENLSIKGPFLFYLQSKEIPALIHLFGRVKSKVASINYVDKQGEGGGSPKGQRYYINLFSKIVNEGGGAKNTLNFINVVYGYPLSNRPSVTKNSPTPISRSVLLL